MVEDLIDQKFDAEWYLSEYPDVKMLGMPAQEHYDWIGKSVLERKPNRQAMLAARSLISINSTQKKEQIAPAFNSNENADEDIDAPTIGEGNVRNSFYLRAGLQITTELPKNLTHSEAEQLARFIQALPHLIDANAENFAPS
jgi:hypothetical protein